MSDDGWIRNARSPSPATVMVETPSTRFVVGSIFTVSRWRPTSTEASVRMAAKQR